MRDVRGALEALDAVVATTSTAEYLAKHRARGGAELEAIARDHRGGEILEVGALPCHLSFCLKRLGYPVLGVDLAPERLADFIAEHQLEIFRCDIEQEPLPFEDGRFGLVLLTEVFEHLRINPIFTMREIRRVTRPGGTLRLTTPNLYGYGSLMRLLRGQGLIDPYTEFAKLERVGHMGHVREYSAYEMRRFLERVGFVVHEVRYEQFGPSWRGRWLDLTLRAVPRLRSYLAITASPA